MILKSVYNLGLNVFLTCVSLLLLYHYDSFKSDSQFVHSFTDIAIFN